LPREEHYTGGQHATTEDQIEISNPCRETFCLFVSVDRAHRLRREDFATMRTPRDGGITRAGDDLLDERIPFATIFAFAHPFWVARATILANKSAFGARH
jgi:hypothetical protein